MTMFSKLPNRFLPTAGALLLATVGAATILTAQSVYTVGDGEGFAYAFASGDAGAYLGVRLVEETEHPEGGARVTRVVEDSPADNAGLREGDVVVEFDGEIVRGPLAMTKRIHAHEPGDAVKIGVIRDGKQRTLEAELGQREEMVFSAPDGSGSSVRWQEWQDALEDRMEALGEKIGKNSYNVRVPSADNVFFGWGKPKLGVELVETTTELREHLGGSEEQGVLIGKVLEDTPASRSGIRVGDLILTVAGESVASVGELREALADKQGETFALRVARDGRVVTVEVTIPEPERDRPTGPRASLPAPAPRPPAAPGAAPRPEPSLAPAAPASPVPLPAGILV